MATASSVKEGDLERLLKLVERREEEEAKKEREEAKRREEEARKEREEARGRKERQRQEMDRLLRIVSDLQGRLATSPHVNGASPQATSGSSLSASAPDASLHAPVSARLPCKARMPSYKSGDDIETFFKRLDTYYALIPGCDDIYKINMLQLAMDEPVYDIAANINIPDEHTTDYDYYKKAYLERFEPRTSVRERRRNFRLINQEKLSVDEFYDVLRKAAGLAFKEEDAEEVDRRIAEQMIYGLADPYMKRRLLETEMESSREVIKAVKLMISAQTLTRETTSTAPSTKTSMTDTTVVASTEFEPRQGRGRERSAGGGRQGGSRRSGSRPTRTPDGKPICFNCGKANHIAAHCQSRGRRRNDRARSYSRSDEGREWRSGRSPPPSYSSYDQGPSSRSPSFHREATPDYNSAPRYSSSTSTEHYRDRDYSPSPARQNCADSHLMSYRPEEGAYSRQRGGEVHGSSLTRRADPTPRTHDQRGMTSPKEFAGVVTCERRDAQDGLVGAVVNTHQDMVSRGEEARKERGGGDGSGGAPALDAGDGGLCSHDWPVTSTSSWRPRPLAPATIHRKQRAAAAVRTHSAGNCSFCFFSLILFYVIFSYLDEIFFVRIFYH
jgi:hypothetical protein